METYEVYCLLPDRSSLEALLETLFEFDGVYPPAGADEPPLLDAAAVVRTFDRYMRDGEGICFPRAKVPGTAGGWLYREWMGEAVIGLSADADAPQSASDRLAELVPGGVVRLWGDQPPPQTRAEFLAAPNDRTIGN
ncbi:MAG: hypothetical protein NXI31_25420 [bacterium]|nr:hypothetical protein [bacterium]